MAIDAAPVFSFVADEAQILAAVQATLQAAIDAAPWPRALTLVVTDILAEPTRILGGCLTQWALFPLCCCAAAGGEWQCALPAAAAAEFYSVALDLLDDVEDDDVSPAVGRHGVAVVLNVTTALLALVHTILKPDNPEHGTVSLRRAQDALWEGLIVATGGQHVDLVAAGCAPLSVEECLDIARRKGGALVEACCRAGAALGTDDLVLIDRFGVLGRSLGLLGQLDNDLRDAGDSVGKSDLVRRKQTIPITVARSHGAIGDLTSAVRQGGLQLAYALAHAERARVQQALEDVAAVCPDPARARVALRVIAGPDGQAPTGLSR